MSFFASFTPAALDWQKWQSVLTFCIMNDTLPISICLLITNLSFSVMCGPGLKLLSCLGRAEPSASSMTGLQGLTAQLDLKPGCGLPITNKKICLDHIQVSDHIYYHDQ